MTRHCMKLLVVAAIAAGPALSGGCQSSAQTGSLVGALVGAGFGQAIGGNTEGTLIGTAVGGGIGYIIGNEGDKDEAAAERRYTREEMNYVTVNMTNSNGSISQVRLKRHGVGYVGTRNEYYNHLPTEDELRPIYGF